MNRLSKLTMSTMTVLCLGFALIPGNAVAQQKSLKEQLVGTWTFVTSADVQKDGAKVDRWGPATTTGSTTNAVWKRAR